MREGRAGSHWWVGSRILPFPELAMPVRKRIPALIELLNKPEGGKHEQCTVYAVILKAAKQDPKTALALIQKAITQHAAQPYYLNELANKIKKH